MPIKINYSFMETIGDQLRMIDDSRQFCFFFGENHPLLKVVLYFFFLVESNISLLVYSCQTGN